MRKSSFADLITLGLLLIILLSINSNLWAKQKDFCSTYAQNSILAHIQNIKSECGLTGSLWDPVLRKHQSWCLKNSKNAAKQNILLRERMLERCGRTMQRDLPWDELDFVVQNELFGQLIAAIAMDDIDSLRLFESQGINLDFEWHLIDGGLLFWAISNQAVQVTRYLIETKSANPNLTSNGGPNPLVKLLNNAPEVNYRLLDYLLRKGSRPNHGGEDSSDESFPITAAAMNNDLQSVQILLKYKANPNLYESVPPLMIAIYRNNSRMVDLFLKHGANPNRGLNGLSCKEINKNKSAGDLLPMDAALLGGNNRIMAALSRTSAKTTKQCLSGS